MLRQVSTVERRGLAPLEQCAWRLAVIGHDSFLAERALRALQRDGLMVTLEAEGTDGPPSVVIVGAGIDAGRLEQTLEWASRRTPTAVLIVVLPAGYACDAGLLLAKGAHGIVHEPQLDDALGPICRAAAAGHVSVPAALRHAIQQPPLSHRERQTLGLALAGLTNAQIAQRLHIAETTVKSHLSGAFRRLGVHSRREAAALLTSDAVLRGSVLSTLRLSEEFSAMGRPS